MEEKGKVKGQKGGWRIGEVLSNNHFENLFWRSLRA
jgi:hypothetical protein